MTEKEVGDLSIEDIERAINEHAQEVQEKFTSRMITIIIAGFGLITVLAWDKVLQDIFLKIFGKREITLGEKLIYALVITFIATSASILLTKYFVKKTKKRDKKRAMKKNKRKVVKKQK